MLKNKFVSFFKSKIVPIINISMLLSLFGVFILLLLLPKTIFSYIRENLSFEIVLQDNITNKQMLSFQNELYHMHFVRALSFIPKDKALDSVSQELQDDPSEFLGFNPLPNLIIVHLKNQYVNPDSLVLITNRFQKFSKEMKEILYPKLFVQTISTYFKKIMLLFLLIVPVLIVIFILLLSIIIKGAINYNRLTIRALQLIGVKKYVIYKEFILTNIFNGLISSLVACTGLYGFVKLIMIFFPEIKFILNINTQYVVYASVFVLGILIVPIIVYFTVRKYIDTDFNKIY